MWRELALFGVKANACLNDLVVSLNYCSQNGGNLYWAPYYTGNPNIGPRTIGNLDQYPFLLGGPTTSAVGVRAGFGLLASAHLTDPAMAHGSFRHRRATAQLAMACLEWILSP